jgi:hypothetical protein
MLHYLDDMDAKINGIQQFLKTKVSEGSRWSPYHPAFERFFYLPTFGAEMQLVNNIEETEPEQE